jgi:integrase
MQRGVIYKHHGSWFLRFYDWRVVEGKPVKKRIGRKLATISDVYPTKRSVLTLAEKILTPINVGQARPESTTRVEEFIENVYLPHVQRTLRPSTHKDYNDIFRFHLKGKLGKLLMRDFRTVHAQRLLASIHSSSGLGHASLLRIKSFLSGTFRHAKQIGVLDGVNPVQDSTVPGRPSRKKMPAYALDQILKILNVVPEPASFVIAIAALSGLRLSELRGLRWSDYTGETLRVSRTVWRTHVGAPKTVESEAEIPVLPVLREVLTKHRKDAPDSAYVFAGPRRGAPLNLANLAARVIEPALKRKGIPWLGWHAFRRGLATNLYALGVQAKTIQSLLRHSDIRTTMNIYTQTVTEDSKSAMRKLEDTLLPFGW